MCILYAGVALLRNGGSNICLFSLGMEGVISACFLEDVDFGELGTRGMSHIKRVVIDIELSHQYRPFGAIGIERN